MKAHIIKNPSTDISMACCMLRSYTKWCITGTPLQNSLFDLYSLMKFLKHEPWDDSWWFKKVISLFNYLISLHLISLSNYIYI